MPEKNKTKNGSSREVEEMEEEENISSRRLPKNKDKYSNGHDEVEEMEEENGNGQYYEENDEENNNEEDALLADVMQEWAAGTSVHGAALASGRQTYSLWFRLLWLCCIITSGAILIWQIRKLITDYEKFEVSTATDIVSPAESLDFPEITICNLNYFSFQRQRATGIVAPKNEQELEQIVTPLEDFILETEFNMVPLNVSDVWKPVITDFGKCWQFRTDIKVAYPGRDNGLWFRASLNQQDFGERMEETFDVVGDYAGIDIFVQEPGTPINHQLPYVTVPPGRQSIVSFKRTQYGREKNYPWTNCYSKSPEYTRTLCRSDCLAAGIANACGCRFMGDPGHTDLPYCDYWRPTEEFINCWLDFDDAAVLAACDKNSSTSCTQPPCEITLYETSRFDLEYNTFALDFYNDDYLTNNVEAIINYKSLQYEVYTQSPSITFASLLSSIGGSMGLFLGISVISIIEIFGDLIGMRVVPRLFGRRQLHGLGSRR